MERNAMIRRLVEGAIEEARSETTHAWLRDVLERGFGGYRRMSDAALARELQMRGLLEFEQPDPSDLDFEDDELDDEDDENEDDRLVLLSEMIAPAALGGLRGP